MASIDLSRVSVTQANELIRKYGADGEDIEVINPDARHHIGVGLIHKVRLHIRGSAGYFCAGLTDGPQVLVDNNVGWGLADNMLGGSVVVRASAPSPAWPSAAPTSWCMATSARVPVR
jgi:glutamate synthase domain-containing protein 3